MTSSSATADHWRARAAAHQSAGRDDAAEACARQALALDTDHAATWLQLASLCDRLQRSDEAEAAYLRALSLDPALSDAHFGLGVLYLRSRQFEAASRHLQLAHAAGADAVVSLCLGQALYMCGRFRGSAAAFDEAAPPAGPARQLHARARTFAAMIDGDVTGALAAYPALAGPEAEPLHELLLTAFSLFSAYGHCDAAAAVGRLRLDLAPDDPVQRYLLAAVEGRPHDRAPADYVEAHFDAFADGFDQKLVDVLGYRVPRMLADMVGTCRATFADMLDLGCGTGLAGEHLRRFGTGLTGVDLSGGMLRRAEGRGVYRQLIKADAIAFLDRTALRFDLVFAADVLIYVGDLAALVAAIADRLTPGGLFAASIETTDASDVLLLPSGRFAHRQAYFEQVTSALFEIVGRAPSEIRLEAGRPAAGMLYVLRRRDIVPVGIPAIAV